MTLVGDDPDAVAQAQRQLTRIGIDRPAGAATGTAADLADPAERSAYPTATFADVAALGDRDVLLDVRRDDERARGGINHAVHVPLADLLARLDELPDGRLWVHCASGFRASVAASLLGRAGRDVVLVDDTDDRAVDLGLAHG